MQMLVNIWAEPWHTDGEAPAGLTCYHETAGSKSKRLLCFVITTALTWGRVNQTYQREQNAVVVTPKLSTFAKSRPYSEGDKERADDGEDHDRDVYHMGVGIALLVGGDRHNEDDQKLSDFGSEAKESCMCDPGACSRDKYEGSSVVREESRKRELDQAQESGGPVVEIRKAKRAFRITRKSLSRKGEHPVKEQDSSG